MDVEAIAHTVREILSRAATGTVVIVRKDGAVEVEAAGDHRSSGERRERPAAVFVRTSAPLAHQEAVDRIRQGFRKLQVLR